MSNWITVEESLKARERAVERERERIIELLKESACCQDECSFHEELTNIIALIKGEQK